MSLQTKGNVAYDLRRFEKNEQDKLQKVEVPKTPATASHRRNFPRILKMTVMLLAIALTVVTLLQSKVKDTELSAQISSNQKILNERRSEATRLDVELNRRVSLKRVEEYAKQELGYQKQEKYQIVYIDLSEGDKAIVNQDAQAGLFGAIRNWFGGLMEYFSK